MVKATDFFQDLFTVDLRADEIITSVQFAPVRSAAYAKLHQRASHYAIVGVAAALDVQWRHHRDGPRRPDRSDVACVASGRRRAGPGGATAVAGDHRRRSSEAGLELSEVNADIHASAEYRRAMVQVFVRRALSAAMARS